MDPSTTAALASLGPKLPPVLNSPVLVEAGLADVSRLPLAGCVAQFIDFLTSSATAAGEPIDRSQAEKFLSHMVRNMGLGPEDLVLMKVFVQRYDSARRSSNATSSGEPAQELTHGMKLLLAAYCSQSLQWDEPLARSTWTLYSRMTWDEFLAHLFRFTAAFDMNLSVSSSEWNQTAWSLTTGSPLLPASASPRGAEFSLQHTSTSATTHSLPVASGRVTKRTAARKSKPFTVESQAMVVAAAVAAAAAAAAPAAGEGGEEHAVVHHPSPNVPLSAP